MLIRIMPKCANCKKNKVVECKINLKHGETLEGFICPTCHYVFTLSFLTEALRVKRKDPAPESCPECSYIVIRDTTEDYKCHRCGKIIKGRLI